MLFGVVSWLGGSLFGLVFWSVPALLAGTQVAPGAAYLKLGAHDFEVRSFFRSWRCRWVDIEEFEAVRPFGFREMVVFKTAKGCAEEVRAPAHPVLMSGCDGRLPDCYRMRGNELARLLNAYEDAWRAAQQ
jgi:hypothetical protein